MADVLTDALQSLEGESLLTKNQDREEFVDRDKSDQNLSYSMVDTEKSTYEFGVQPEKIVQVADLPVSF